jgi:hypothetical protein
MTNSDADPKYLIRTITNVITHKNQDFKSESNNIRIEEGVGSDFKNALN